MSCEDCTLDCSHKKGIHYDIWGEGIECKCKSVEEELPWDMTERSEIKWTERN